MLWDPCDNKIICRRDRCVLRLFYATGMRRNETANLTLDRVTLSARTGRVHIIGKGSKHRVVPFEGPIVPLIKTWLIVRAQYVRDDDNHLFISLFSRAAGHGLDNGGLHKTIKRIAIRMGMRDNNAFLHKLRSTYATDMYDEGIPVGEIRILMGHSSETTTWRYIAISERHLQKSRISSARWRHLGVAS